MEMFVMVLNKVECLEPILEEMLNQGFGGATIFDSTGMLRVLDGDENVDLPMLGLLRHFHNPERAKCKTMFAVIDESQRQALVDIIDQKTGGLNQPDTGIVFTVPVGFAAGLNKDKTLSGNGKKKK